MSLLDILGLNKSSIDKALSQKVKVLEGIVKTNKIGELLLSDGRTVELFQPKVGHFVYAADSNEALRNTKLVAATILIEGEQPSIKDILNLGLKDFSNILTQLNKEMQ